MTRDKFVLEDVRFKAEKRQYDYSSCDGCFAVGKVTVLTLPSTRYHDRKTISTRYYERWFCDECLGKLNAALKSVERGES